MVHLSGTVTTKVGVTKEKSAKINVLTLIMLLEDLTIWHIKGKFKTTF